MSATEVQNPSGSIHTGTPWSWVGIAAVMVLILTVLSIGLARDTGETTAPPTGRTETTAPRTAAVAENGIQTPATGDVVRGGGYVVMPARPVAAHGAGEGTQALPSRHGCPGLLALKLFC